MIRDCHHSATLRNIPVFRNFSEAERRQMAEIAQERSFEPGERVLEQGQRSQNLWILLEGHCQVTRDSEHDGSVTLAELEPHSVFGELSFFSPAPHSANVVAKTPVKLLRIAREDFDRLLGDEVTAAYKLAYNVVESVAHRLRRMDEWVSELASRNGTHEEPEGHEERTPEWRKFREKMFSTWNL